jgi:class 3 adenylate cyclase
VLVVDVEKFGDPRRTNRHKLVIRDGLYHALRVALEKVGIMWDECDHEDRGDGILTVIPSWIPKSLLVEFFPAELVTALISHNQAHCVEEQIRLRAAIHAGELLYDGHGVVGRAIELAFRLLDASGLKAALAESASVLALITSTWFYDEVVRHSHARHHLVYHQVRVHAKETDTAAWICLPDNQYARSSAYRRQLGC